MSRFPSEDQVRPTIVHLTASPGFGGVERQMIGLARELERDYQTAFLSFRDEDRCWDFIHQAEHANIPAYALESDFPNVLRAMSELTAQLRSLNASILIPHGYKSNILGLIAARRLRIPIVSVSHGWTGESLTVKLYERLDKLALRLMDEIVCVSEGQASKVVRHVPASRVRTICDSVLVDRFGDPNQENRKALEQFFDEKPQTIVGAAGRLSPEKGYTHLVDAANKVLARHPETGFILFGDGPLRDELQSQIKSLRLSTRFILAGHTSQLDKFFPEFDLFVLPSFTEGLPNVVLESFAARVPVVATAVGGTPEAVDDGVNGFLVPSGCADPLADRIEKLISDPKRRHEMGIAGRRRVEAEFTFPHQANRYRELLQRYIGNGHQR